MEKRSEGSREDGSRGDEVRGEEEQAMIVLAGHSKIYCQITYCTAKH